MQHPRTLPALLVVLILASALAAPAQEADEAFVCEVGKPHWHYSVLPDPYEKSVVTGPIVLRGLTVLVDFPDLAAAIPLDVVDDFMNEPGFTGAFVGGVDWSSNGSVRDYFLDVSDGRVDYSNKVVGERYLAAETYEYWRHQPMEAMDRLVGEIIAWLDEELGHDFTTNDADGDGRIDGLNILTAGGFIGGGALHPHAQGDLPFVRDGIMIDRYECTNTGNAGPQLAVVCHENGHMLFGWPDLYRQSPYDDAPNLRSYCLMSLVVGDNPQEPNGYLKWRSGFATPVKLSPRQVNNFLRTDVNTVAFVQRSPEPGPNEYFVLENRQQTGRDAQMGDSGIAIYHVTESEDDFDIVLVEADGRYDLLNGDPADATDLWSAPSATTFDFATTPAATWNDGTPAFFRISDVSANGPLMTFNFTEYPVSTVEVESYPGVVQAGWTLRAYTGRTVFSGEGAATMQVPAGLMYQMIFEDLPLWTPTAGLVQNAVTSARTATTFSQSYVPPFVPLAGHGLDDAGSVVAAAAVDVDGDGDDDVFVVNGDGANQLLRNDGLYDLIDVAPAVLADADASGSAWADVDGDGDQDVFLFGAGGLKMLLSNDGGDPVSFTDVTDQVSGLESVGVVNSASWVDIDQDGALDLFLTTFATGNYRFDGDTAAPFALVPGAVGFASIPAGAVGAAWGDLNNDGWPDLFATEYDPAVQHAVRLVMNDHGALVHPNIVGFAYFQDSNITDAEMGDFNGDGLTDLALVRGGYGAEIRLQANNRFDSESPPAWSSSFSGASVTGIEVGDFDDDGRTDLYCGLTGGLDVIAVNRGIDALGDLAFDRAPLGFDHLPGAVTAVALLDADGDGGQDVFVGRAGEPNTLMRNIVPGRGHWLELDLAGTAAHVDARAAKVKVIAGGVTQERDVETGGDNGQSSRRVHFGLGDATTVDAVLVTWAGGATTVLANVAVDQRIAFVQAATKAEAAAVPTTAAVFRGAYPNPFNPTTNIAFSLGRVTDVRVAVYGLDGRRVADLLDDRLEAGDHVVPWDGRDALGRRMSSGVYFCRVDLGGQAETLKLTLIK